jgi:hypothetical protein
VQTIIKGDIHQGNGVRQLVGTALVASGDRVAMATRTNDQFIAMSWPSPVSLGRVGLLPQLGHPVSKSCRVPQNQSCHPGHKNRYPEREER